MPRLSLGLGIQTIRKVGGFSPGNLSGLSLWLKADAGVSLSGSNVTAWADQSGNGNNGTAKTGNATKVSNVINGKPVLRFDGTANLITNNFFANNYNTPITIIGVAKASASTVRGEQPTARYIAGATNNGGYETALSFGVNKPPNFACNIGISYVGGTDIESNPIGENAIAVSTEINNGSQISFFVNGSSIGSINASNWSGGNNSTGAFAIGSSITLDEIDNFFFVGDIAEIIIYNRAITTTERQQVEGYLANKYAIQLPNINNMFLPQLWLKADAGVTTSGSNVTSWTDQSGNGNNATAVDAPTLSTISGKTFMDFAGGYFTGNELITSPYATIMCVARFSAQLDVSVMFEQFSNDFGGNMSIYWGFDLNNGFRLYNGQDLNSSSLTNNNQTYLFGATFNNDTGILYLNSSQDASGYCGELTPAGNYLLGRWPDEQRTSYTMKMAEIIVYNRVLTTTERQQVEAYLNTKYAIY